MVPKLYSGTSTWFNDNKNSWRDESLQDSEIRQIPLSVICVKKEIDGIGTCKDIDECVMGYCGYGSCSNSIGSFNCTCPNGFLQGAGTEQCQTCEREGFEPGAQFESCQDIDECENFNCGEGICQNNIGSKQTCICTEGFINSLSDQSAICGELTL